MGNRLMSNEREDFFQPLKFVDYDIAGNVFRAYYDMDGKLVFVIDFLINDTKPNVLLVINPVGDRKWDDILMNDYGVDLETVRPKKDNKYQKLDVEYTGLAEYDALIQAHEDGDDIADALADLQSFRYMAAMRAALERMAAAELTASRARETIDKADESVQELQTRLKVLRNKLTVQRRDIGKEPTKQSAAKILRTESQIDLINEKLLRAKKRQANAKHRLNLAIDEAEIAREILDVLEDAENIDDNVQNLPAEPIETAVAPIQDGHDDVLVIRPAPTSVVPHEDAPVPMMPESKVTDVVKYDDDDDFDDDSDEEYDDGSNQEVEPLFSEDPKILNEDIAFQPIDFGAEISDVVTNEPSVPSDSVPKQNVPEIPPLVFTPPVTSTPVVHEEVVAEPEVAPVSSPVLDSLTPIPEENQMDVELMANIEGPVVAPVEANMPRPESPMVTEEETGAKQTVSDDSVMPEIEVASDNSGFRPLSPIAAQPVAQTGGADNTQHKPTMLYYGLLIVLIVLSVFTLWIYQRSLNDAVPELGAQTQVVAEEAVADSVVADDVVVTNEVESLDNPFLDTEMAIETVAETENVVADEPQVMPMPVEVAVSDSVVADDVAETLVESEESAILPVVEDTTPEEAAVATDTPVVAEPAQMADDEVVESAVAISTEDILAKKPVYGVNREEAVFVADSEYETDAPAVGTAVEPAYYQAEQPVVVDDETVVAADDLSCEDGTLPDADGCCGDEVLMDIDGRAACCSETSGDCFDPLI